MHERSCYEALQCAGVSSNKIESIAFTSGGSRMFVGTGDGHLVLYDCRRNGDEFVFNRLDTIRKSKERKQSFSALKVFENWRIMVGIIDGIIMAYDTHTFQCLSQLLDSKGCTQFSIDEKTAMMAVVNKRKISLFTWQGSGFVPQRELSLNETPKFVHCKSGHIIVGYKKSYDTINLSTFNSVPIVDIEKEHNMVGCDISSNPRRPASVLLSVGLQGILVEIAPTSKGKPTVFDHRIEWSSPPLACKQAFPYVLVSLLAQGTVEIHDLSSMIFLQSLNVSQALNLDSLSSSVSLNFFLSRFTKAEDHIFVGAGDKIACFHMVPLATQISRLSDGGHYEDALNLHTISLAQGAALPEIDVGGIHEMYGNALFENGDFDNALNNYSLARTPTAAILGLFPEFVPSALQQYCSSIPSRCKVPDSTTPLVGNALNRAAEALKVYCEKHREAVSSRAISAEKVKNAGISGLPEISGTNSWDGGDIYDAVRSAELLDSTFLSALINCSPPDKNNIITLLSGPNRCHPEHSAVMLASKGKSYTEGLLWLYRSNGEHRRVLAALTEDRCVDSGAWTREQFYTWMADYLRWLWFSEDSLLPPFALQSLKLVLEYDAELGLSVLISRPKGRSTFGGKGVTVNEVVGFLKGVPINLDETTRQSVLSGSNTGAKLNYSQRKSRQTFSCGGIMTPLINGSALGIAYLEWLVGSGAAPASMHDEFSQLLVDSIPMNSGIEHSRNNLELCDNDVESTILYKIYRRKLQYFLQHSTEVRSERILKKMPVEFLYEQALLMAKMGQHEEVMDVYINKLYDISLARAYCDTTYHRIMEKDGKKEAGAAYLCLFDVILASSALLAPPDDLNVKNYGSIASNMSNVMLSPDKARLACVIGLAEKYFERFDPNTFLTLLGPDTPIKEISAYLNIIIEYNGTKRKNLQVLHQVMRMQEVNLRISNANGK